MDTSSFLNNTVAATISALGAVIANTVSPPVTFEVGSGFIWGMGFGILAGAAMWMDARLRDKKRIEIVPLLIVIMLSAAAGFIGYTALSMAGLSAMAVTGGTSICGMLGGPGLRAVCRRGMKELNKALGQKDHEPDKDQTDNTDK